MRSNARSGALVALTATVLLAGASAALGAFMALGNLTAPGRDAVNPQVAIAADGDAIAIWERSDGANFRLEARRIPAGGSAQAAQTLSATGQDAFSPAVAIDGDGDAIAAWVRSDGTNLRIEGRTDRPRGPSGRCCRCRPPATTPSPRP